MEHTHFGTSTLAKVLPKLRFTFTFLSLGILLGISSIALVANAQTEEAGVPPEVIAADRAEQARRAEVRRQQQALGQPLMQRVENLAANMSNRMDATVVRLENIADRLSTRTALIRDTGVDTAAAETALADAQTALTEARTRLANIDTIVYETVSSPTPQASWQAAREEFITIRELLFTAHISLRDAITALKISLAGNAPQGVSDAVRQAITSETDGE